MKLPPIDSWTARDVRRRFLSIEHSGDWRLVVHGALNAIYSPECERGVDRRLSVNRS